MDEQQPVLTEALYAWNEKLEHGIPLSKELLFSLFGSDLAGQFPEERVLIQSFPDGSLKEIYISPWVNEDNAFQIIFAYKYITVDVKDNTVTDYFTFGDEDELLYHLNYVGV